LRELGARTLKSSPSAPVKSERVWNSQRWARLPESLQALEISEENANKHERAADVRAWSRDRFKQGFVLIGHS
jgi:hypothetical protein